MIDNLKHMFSSLTDFVTGVLNDEKYHDFYIWCCIYFVLALVVIFGVIPWLVGMWKLIGLFLGWIF